LLDPRPMAASNLRARRPPWSAPKHADQNPKNEAGRHIRTVRVFQRCHAAGLSVDPQVHGPLHRCKAAPASQGHQTQLAHPLAGQPAGEGKQ